MRFRTISYLVTALVVGACGASSDSTDTANENLLGGSLEEKKTDAGRDCRASAPGEPSPCAKGGSGHNPDDHGRNDAGKGHSDGDDDDDDDEREDGGKKAP
jgi:hypothetical protein